jgi:hypothetical protein
MLIAVPAEHWTGAAGQTAQSVVQTLLRLARRILPKQVATSKRAPDFDTQRADFASEVDQKSMFRRHLGDCEPAFWKNVVVARFR